VAIPPDRQDLVCLHDLDAWLGRLRNRLEESCAIAEIAARHLAPPDP
jgi:hypothetical protein